MPGTWNDTVTTWNDPVTTWNDPGSGYIPPPPKSLQAALLWVAAAGWSAAPKGTTLNYFVSRPLMGPGQVQKFRAWKYDTSLPYDPKEEINLGMAMYDTMLLAQQACQYDWDQLSPDVSVTSTDASGGTVRWQQRTRSTNRF